jgi:hypothetical protein
LPYLSASLHRLAESIPLELIPGLHQSLKIPSLLSPSLFLTSSCFHRLLISPTFFFPLAYFLFLPSSVFLLLIHLLVFCCTSSYSPTPPLSVVVCTSDYLILLAGIAAGKAAGRNACVANNFTLCQGVVSSPYSVFSPPSPSYPSPPAPGPFHLSPNPTRPIFHIVVEKPAKTQKSSTG